MEDGRKKMEFYGENLTFEDLLLKINTFDQKRFFQGLAKSLSGEQRKIIPDLKNNVIKKLNAIDKVHSY